MQLDEKEVDMFRTYYSGIMYKVGAALQGVALLRAALLAAALLVAALLPVLGALPAREPGYCCRCSAEGVLAGPWDAPPFSRACSPAGNPDRNAALLHGHQAPRRQPHGHGHILFGAPLL